MTNADKDWQRGYPLDQLKQLAGIFKTAHKQLVYGAFGLVKERDIAEAMSKGNLIVVGGPPKALAIIANTGRPSEREDFAQRPYTIGPGIQIKALAGKNEAAVRAVIKQCIASSITPKQSSLFAPTSTASVWAEIFEEDIISKGAILKEGFSYVTTRVSAGGEVKGVYVRGMASPLAPLSRAEAATLEIVKAKFLSSSELNSIRDECKKFDQFWAQHYSNYNKRQSWTAFALRGYTDDPSFIIKPEEMSKSWKEENTALLANKPQWTKAAKKFPTAVKVVERLGCELDRVRFMRLRPKDGELSRHADITDRSAGIADGFVSRMHIPINTSEGVTFYGWDAHGNKLEKKFPAGALCYLDQRKPHAAKNTDPTLERIHLVADCFANERLRKMVGAA